MILYFNYLIILDIKLKKYIYIIYINNKKKKYFKYLNCKFHYVKHSLLQ